MTLPRFLLDDGVVTHLANVDSSFGQDLRDGRVTVNIDYRRGVPASIQVVRVATTLNLKVHVTTESA